MDIFAKCFCLQHAQTGQSADLRRFWTLKARLCHCSSACCSFQWLTGVNVHFLTLKAKPRGRDTLVMNSAWKEPSYICYWWVLTWWSSGRCTSVKPLNQILNIPRGEALTFDDLNLNECSDPLREPPPHRSNTALLNILGATEWHVLDASLSTRSLWVGPHPAAFTHSLRIQWTLWNVQIRILILRATALCVNH